MPPTPIQRDRMLGSLWGVAVGNALGLPYEGKANGSYKPPPQMVSFTRNGSDIPAGTWGEDTTMTLWMMESLLSHQPAVDDWRDAIEQWIQWNATGHRSITARPPNLGHRNREVFKWYQSIPGGRQAWPEVPEVELASNACGNGSLMRIAPIAIRFYKWPSFAQSQAEGSSMVTHPADEAIDACRLATIYIIGFIQKAELPLRDRKIQVLTSRFVPYGGPMLQFTSISIHQLWIGAGFKGSFTEQINTSGHAVYTLRAALWALWKADTFTEGMLELLRLGGDVDTVCSVYGQLAGACFGSENIPQSWKAQLREVSYLKRWFEGFVDTQWPDLY